MTVSSTDDFGAAGLLAAGLPPEDAAAAVAALGDVTAAAICRMLGFYEHVLDGAGWDAPPRLWCIERLPAGPGRAGLAGFGGWQLPMPAEDGDDLAGAVRDIAAFVAGPRFAAAAQQRDLVAWAVASEGWIVPLTGPGVPLAGPSWLRERTEVRALYASDRAGLRYQLLRPRGGSALMFVTSCVSGVCLGGLLAEAVAELALAAPVPGGGAA